MPEEKEQELDQKLVSEEHEEIEATATIEKSVNEDGNSNAEVTETNAEEAIDSESTSVSEEVIPKEKVESKTKEEIKSESPSTDDSESEDNVLEEIDESNAEDAEDNDNHHRHEIPVLDYHAMSMENLTGEFQKLVKNEKVQAIKKHVDGIKHEFDLKFQEFLEHKKEEFVANGGNEIDFRYNSVTKKQFNEVYGEYREKRNAYYNSLERNLKENLAIRLQLIEELKGFVSVEEDINTTYKNFKDVQDRWRKTGPVPRTHYNNVWKTYQHHIEIFYDFLHLNRELRDLDFKHNLEEKQKLSIFDNHKILQQQIKQIEEQRDAFFKAGKVPQKNLKKISKITSTKNEGLLELANSLKDSDDWEVATQEMKRIQTHKEEGVNLEKKIGLYGAFERALNFQEIGERYGLRIKAFIEEWKTIGHIIQLVKDVIKRVEAHKQSLETWKAKLKKLNIMENNLYKEVEETEEVVSSEEE
ncbi:hypothetical protein GQR58_030664 [Nymphon striatum]|nr:hypothetical protein GQR58_030664 [Nymphon striatum]